MPFNKRCIRAGFGLILTIIILTGLLALAPISIQAGPGLPPRPSAPQPAPPDDDNDLIGAYIVLNVANMPSDAWTVVQWQDNADNWHDVPGWRGTTDQPSYRLWWVDNKDFGTGPFRWIVTAGKDGRILSMSHNFTLPDEPFEVVAVTSP